MREEKDRGSKWLIGHHGDAILRLAGVIGFRSWRAVTAELVQPKQLPDGLLEVRFADGPRADLFLVEIATYPDRRVEEQVLRDAMLVLLDRRVLPEVVTLVLHPRGNLRLAGSQQQASRLGFMRLEWGWRVVELWTLSAEDLLAADDVGLVPWLPLTRFAGPPEALFQQCRERIDRQARPEERANLLAVTQILARLRYNDPQMLALIGGQQMILESPLIQDLLDQRQQQTMQTSIVQVLQARFGPVPEELAAQVRAVRDVNRLNELINEAARCSDLDAFRTRLGP